MIRSLIFCFGLLSLSVIEMTSGCDIILRVKSLTETPFKAQIIAPNGKTNEKKILNKNERLIFQQKADECGLGPFQIKTFSKGGDNKFDKEEHSVKVTLNGIGVVNYEVGNDLKPKQIFRQGAECEGECAPLSVTHHHHHHHHHHNHNHNHHTTTTTTTAKA